MRRSDFLYTACYCEENVWHLAGDARITGERRFVVFISNRDRCCALWRQRASSSPALPVLWDYHVVLWVDRSIWDLDTRLDFPIDAPTYFEETFADDLGRAPPRFRVIEASEFRKTFASDRSHMKDNPAPPPPWPKIGQGMNLMRFVDMEAPFIGDVLDLDAIRKLD